MPEISVVYFATPDIALETFKSLLNDKNFKVKALVTQPSKPSGRGKKIVDSDIKKTALQAQIPIFEPLKLSQDEQVLSELKKIRPDFFITFAYGQILSQQVLDIPKYGTINLHASLLPKYRGSSPITECLLNGDNKTGVTTMVTELSLDTGDICLMKEIELTDDTTYCELCKKISDISPSLLKDTLFGLKEGTIKPYKQNENLATYTKKITKEDKIISFDTDSSKLHNKIRAMAEVNTVHFKYNGKIVKVLSSKNLSELNAGKTGEILDITKEGITIKCSRGAILFKTLKPEGKNLMCAYDWSLGSKIKKGDILEC